MSVKKTGLILPDMLGTAENDRIDTLRLRLGNFEIFEEVGIFFEDTSESSDIILEDITEPVEHMYPIPSDEGRRLGRKQTITISERELAEKTTPTSWAAKVNALVPLYENEYLFTSFESPLTNEEVLNLEADAPSAGSGVDYVYNFYNRAYESILGTVNDHEVIQSLYSMFDESSKVGTQESMLTDDTPLYDVNILPPFRGKRDTTLARSLKRNKNRVLQRQKFENQIVPIENMPLLADYEGSKYLFPMYTNINITLDEKTEFVRLAKETSMGIALTRDLEGVTDTTDVLTAPSVQVETINFSTSVVNADGTEQLQASSVPVKMLDLMEWSDLDAPAYAYDGTDPDGYPAPPNFYFIGSDAGSFVEDDSYGETDSITVGTAECSSFATLNNTFKEGLGEIANNNRKRIKGIFEGKENYSETVMYKIQKLLGPIQSPPQAPIQTFHFMNSAEVFEFISNERKFKFVDTQVKYNQEYAYIVTAYQMVVGEKYIYNNVETMGPNSAGHRTAKIDVNMLPTVKLVEVPLFVSTGKILDNPPLPPEVRFFPLANDRNKLKMFFTISTGTEDSEPITLTEQEAADAAQIAINQARTDGKITFRTDDSASSFQVYRLTRQPATIDDFSGSLYKIASTQPPKMQRASSATIEISQVPNVKYYYMFRTVDIHGGLSNPSAIYEIELYNDGGAGYPIIRHYDLASPNPKTTTKSARKIIQIVPRIAQAFLNERASGLVNDSGEFEPASGNRHIVLGNQAEPLFGKKFKIRLTSKSTGKKVDLNINFKTKRIRGEIES